jgi:hypothetical protein
LRSFLRCNLCINSKSAIGFCLPLHAKAPLSEQRGLV